MKLNTASPPEGTVRDWLNSRADAGGTAVTFPETGEELSWEELRASAAETAADLTSQGIAKGESIAVVHPNGLEGIKAL